MKESRNINLQSGGKLDEALGNGAALRLEEEYRRRLQGIGALGISSVHDICNTLVTVLGHVELAKVKVLQASLEIASHLGEIEAAARRASELCRELLDFAHARSPGLQVLRLEELLRGMRPLLGMIVPKCSSLRLEIAPDLPEIKGDIGQVHDLLLSLIVKVLETSSQPPSILTLRLGLETLNEEEAVFFEADSEETRLRTRFPLSTPERSRTDPSALSDEKPWSATGRVLLVDDESSVRAVARQMLERIGLDVESAVDGCDAVELLEQDPARFSCVLLDLSMPNMNGDTCFSELRRLRPDLPVILVSGSGDRGSLEFLSEAPATAFIHKPYSMTALRRELQRLMKPRGN